MNACSLTYNNIKVQEKERMGIHCTVNASAHLRHLSVGEVFAHTHSYKQSQETHSFAGLRLIEEILYIIQSFVTLIKPSESDVKILNVLSVLP